MTIRTHFHHPGNFSCVGFVSWSIQLGITPLEGVQCIISISIGYELDMGKKLQRSIRGVYETHEILSSTFPNSSPVLVPYLLVWPTLDVRDVYSFKRYQIRVGGRVQKHFSHIHVSL